MYITFERFKLLLAACALCLVTLPQAQASGLSDRLDELKQLTFSGSQKEIRDGLDRLEQDLARADNRQMARFVLLKARADGLEKKTAQAIESLDLLLRQRGSLDPDLELRALNLAANLLIIDERFKPGFNYFRQALELASVARSPAMRAETYNVAAEFHARIGEYATTIEYANKAMEQVSREEAPRAHCIALERRARARLRLDRVEQAIADYRTAVALCDAVTDLVFAGVSRTGLASALVKQGDIDRAEATLERAVDMLSRRGFIEGELEARYLLANLMLDQNRLDEAKQLMRPAIEWIEIPGNYALRAEALGVMARISSVENDKRLEYQHRRRAIEFSQQHVASIRHMHFSLLMSAQDDRARQRELELLRSRNALAELEQERDRQTQMAMTMGGFGSVAAGILLLALLLKAGRDRHQFQRLSQRDGLTELYNHTRFFELAEQAFQRARQNAIPFSLIVADIDLFKRVNDEYGHLVGDSVLARVGSRLRSAFGKDAVLGRLGGEEFGIALSNCDVDTAVARIEHFRAILNRRRSDETEPAITMSFGVAELSRERSLDVLYARTDQALYDAKDAGRNRVITVARINLSGVQFVT